MRISGHIVSYVLPGRTIPYQLDDTTYYTSSRMYIVLYIFLWDQVACCTITTWTWWKDLQSCTYLSIIHLWLLDWLIEPKECEGTVTVHLTSLICHVLSSYMIGVVYTVCVCWTDQRRRFPWCHFCLTPDWHMGHVSQVKNPDVACFTPHWPFGWCIALSVLHSLFLSPPPFYPVKLESWDSLPG
jgi:hypothetical protein